MKTRPTWNPPTEPERAERRRRRRRGRRVDPAAYRALLAQAAVASERRRAFVDLEHAAACRRMAAAPAQPYIAKCAAELARVALERAAEHDRQWWFIGGYLP